jgi:hypothetical protein
LNIFRLYKFFRLYFWQEQLQSHIIRFPSLSLVVGQFAHCPTAHLITLYQFWNDRDTCLSGRIVLIYDRLGVVYSNSYG